MDVTIIICLEKPIPNLVENRVGCVICWNDCYVGDPGSFNFISAERDGKMHPLMSKNVRYLCAGCFKFILSLGEMVLQKRRKQESGDKFLQSVVEMLEKNSKKKKKKHDG